MGYTIVHLKDKKNNIDIQDIIDDDLLSHVRSVWNNGDALIENLQSHDYFKGYKTWNDLNHNHYKIFILGNFYHFDKMGKIRNIESTKEYASMMYLITCFIYYLKTKIDQEVHNITIVRDEDDLFFNIVSNMTSSLDDIPDKPTPKISKKIMKVVVDNSKKN